MAGAIRDLFLDDVPLQASETRFGPVFEMPRTGVQLGISGFGDTDFEVAVQTSVDGVNFADRFVIGVSVGPPSEDSDLFNFGFMGAGKFARIRATEFSDTPQTVQSTLFFQVSNGGAQLRRTAS